MIVPAHNEENVIGRCLTALLTDADAADFRVIVVSNGSSDRTVDVARAAAIGWGGTFEAVELAQPSKVAAIREGIRLARGGAVVVLDADVEMSATTARALASTLDSPAAIVASPRLRVMTAGASSLVRHYYRAWLALPYVSTSMIGSGVFGLSSAALLELGDLPDVTNDDGWIRRSFPSERHVVLNEEFTVRAALTARALIARRARIINGNREIAARLGRSDPAANSTAALVLLVRTRRIGVLDSVAFIAIGAASRAVALLRRVRHDRSWSTDQTTRRAVPAHEVP